MICQIVRLAVILCGYIRQQGADGQVLRADTLALAAFDAVGGLAAVLRIDLVVSAAEIEQLLVVHAGEQEGDVNAGG